MASTFEEVKAKCDMLLASVPSMEQSMLRNEIKEICSQVNISSHTMSPADLASDMECIQAARDRMVEILADAHMCATIKKDVAKMMTSAAKKTSAESSSDRREGDAVIKVSEYSLSSTAADAFYKFCDIMYSGLNNKYNSVGKRIACLQESVRITAFGSTALATDMAQPKDTSRNFDTDPKASPSSSVSANGGTTEFDWDGLS